MSSNTRKRKGRKDADVDFRRTFYFDVEKDGSKPSFSDKGYYTKLIRTVFYLKKKLEEKGLRVSMVKESGRGIHVGVKIEPLERERWDKKFKYWFKNLCKEMERERPYTRHKILRFGLQHIQDRIGSGEQAYEIRGRAEEEDIVPRYERAGPRSGIGEG